MPRSTSCMASLPEPIDPAAAAQIAAATGGNPLALIDLASELDARRLTESSLADEPIPVGHHLEAYYLRRVRRPRARRPAWLLVAAADSTGNLDLIRRPAKALGCPRRRRRGAERGRPGRAAGTVRFRHPLVQVGGLQRRARTRSDGGCITRCRCRSRSTWRWSSSRPGTPRRRRSAPTRRSPTGSSGWPTWPAQRGGFPSRASVLARAAALTPPGRRKDARLVSAAEAALAAGAAQVAEQLLDEVDAATCSTRCPRPDDRRCAPAVALFTADPALRRSAADMLAAAECVPRRRRQRWSRPP